MNPAAVFRIGAVFIIANDALFLLTKTFTLKVAVVSSLSVIALAVVCVLGAVVNERHPRPSHLRRTTNP